MDCEFPAPAGTAPGPRHHGEIGGMSPAVKAPVGASAPRMLSLAAPVLEMTDTYLSPADPFPTTLVELELVEVLVLHSRITRQLEREYTDPAGPHPVTRDRAQELAAELDTRQDFLAPAAPAPPPVTLAAPGAEAPRAARRKPPGPRRRPAMGRHPATPAATGQPTPAAPGRDEQPSRALSPVGEEEQGEGETPIHDLARLRPGEQVEVWHRGHIQCVGTVEETAPALGVVWIRDAVDGYRRLIHTQADIELRYPRPRDRG